MSRTERDPLKDINWHQHEDMPHRRQVQRRFRQAVRVAVVRGDWDGAERRFRRSSGWETY